MLPPLPPHLPSCPRIPPPFRCDPPMPGTNHHSLRPKCHISSCVRGCLSCLPNHPTLPRCPGAFGLLRPSVAKRHVISSTVVALLQRVTAEWSLLCRASHHSAHVVACPVISWAVATCGLAAAFVLSVAPSPAEFTSVVGACIRVHFQSVPHPCRLDAPLDQTLCRHAPLYNKYNLWCGDFSILLTLPHGAGVLQPPYLGGDCYAVILRFRFL